MEGEVQNSEAEDFLEEDFLEGNANAEYVRSVLDPPTRSRTSPFAGGSETSEAPQTQNKFFPMTKEENSLNESEYCKAFSSLKCSATD